MKTANATSPTTGIGNQPNPDPLQGTDIDENLLVPSSSSTRNCHHIEKSGQDDKPQEDSLCRIMNSQQSNEDCNDDSEPRAAVDTLTEKDIKKLHLQLKHGTKTAMVKYIRAANLWTKTIEQMIQNVVTNCACRTASPLRRIEESGPLHHLLKHNTISASTSFILKAKTSSTQ